MKNGIAEQTIVFSKVPVGCPNEEIVQGLVSNSLDANGISYENKHVRFTEVEVMQIYSHVPVTVLCALLEKLAKRVLSVWLITGNNVIVRVRMLSGQYTNPMISAKATWRRTLVATCGAREVTLPIVREYGPQTMYENYLHASSSQKEAKRDVGVLGRYFR